MNRVATIAVALSIALCAVAATAVVEPAGASPYVIIVHPGNRQDVLRKTFIADAFLKKITRWSNGTSIRPADLSYSSAARRAFSRFVLNRSAGAVRAYWQQRIFAGLDVPPPHFDRDDDIVRYVLNNEGAIGYATASTDLKGTRIIRVVD